MIFLKVLISISVKKHLSNVILCKFYYFVDKSFKYGPYLCDACYDMFMKTVSMQNLTIINHNGNYYLVIYAYNIKMSSQKIKFNTRRKRSR